ncbi:outer membrane beta-barrel protein [Nitrobacter sp.]|uniref:outer membrane beta-barrel protein n=2 Tax=Nitrobacter sp. TaxID=29420 RepID=UPI003F64E6B7
MTLGPATGRRQRASLWRAVLACLVLIGPGCLTAEAQTLTRDLMNPVRGGFFQPQDSDLRRISDAGADDAAPASSTAAPSRIGRIPDYGVSAAAGAGDTGYDSLNRRRKKPKPYSGAPKPKQPPGPGNFIAVPPPPPLSVPPSSTANKPPVAPAMAGRVDGQPARRRLKRDDDPFGAVGNYVGGFLVKSAVELSGGYDTNPGRFDKPKGSAFYMVSPEFVAASDWERHSLLVDLRGSFTGYERTFPPGFDNSGQPVASPVPTNVDRPDFTGKADGRLDVTHDTRLNSELRLRIGTDNPGSPNIQAGLARYPLYATTGGTAGIEHDFNRLQVSLNGTVDRTTYQDSRLTDGTSTPNDDRNFNQYGGIARVSYDLMPGVKPFGEVEADTRVHDTRLDRNGFQRDSSGGYAKAGTSFEFTRLLTGEASIGYAARSYADPRLNQLTGLLTSASLVWSATPLTTAKFISVTSVDESTLAGVSGVLTRTYTFEVDHDFRRWLSAVGRFTYGTQDYQGSTRSDEIYSISGDLVYKLTREFQIKAQVRRDILSSNIPGAGSASTVVMLGVRLQR